MHSRSEAPIVDGSGDVVQSINDEGAISITVKSDGYIDSGFVMKAGKLGDLGSITVEGSGDYGLNLYFDLDKDGEFFTWDGSAYKDVGNDAYATGESAPSDRLVIDDSSSFYLMVEPYGSYTLAELKANYGLDTPVGIWVGVTSMDGAEKTATIESVTVAEAATTDIPVLYYTGKDFNRSEAPIVDGSGDVVQSINDEGAISITVKSDGYIDSGFVMKAGKLGDLGSITVEGSGDYGLNLYFDLDQDGEFFTWDGSAYKDVGDDAYATGESATSDRLVTDDSSSFYLMVEPYGSYTLAELKAKYGLDTPVGIWVGVTSMDGAEKTATIESVTVEEAATTDIPVLYYTGKDFNRSEAPIVDGSGDVVQSINDEGAISITVKSDGYIDSGFVMKVGKLGDLGSITVEGSGDYGLNLYFDLDKDGEFFTWDGSAYKDVGNDAYATGESATSDRLVIDDSTSFFLMVEPYGSYTLAELKAEYGLDTPVGIWIGVTSMDGAEKTATIESVTVSH